MPQCNPETSKIEEGVIGGEQMLMTHKQSAELTKPRVGTLHDPAASVAAHLASIFIAPPFVVLAVGCNQLDDPPFQSLT